MDRLVPKPSKPALSDTVRLNAISRRNNWVPALDSKEPRTDGRSAARNGGEASERKEGGGGGEGNAEGEGSSKTAVTLPSIVSSGNGLTLSHGLPSSSPRRTYLVSPLDDEPDTYTNSTAVPATLVPTPGVSGKPILKPFNQDPSVVKLHSHHPYDPFFPRPLQPTPHGVPSFNGALSVRGATMYPLSTEGSRLGSPDDGRRRSHSSMARRRDTDLRKRAVRFSISDQVFEFTPNEPVSP